MWTDRTRYKIARDKGVLGWIWWGMGERLRWKDHFVMLKGVWQKFPISRGMIIWRKEGVLTPFSIMVYFTFNFNVCILSIKKKNIRDLQPFPQFKQRESKGTVKIAEWGRTLRSESIFGNWKPFKSDEMSFILPYKLFLFSFTFWSCRKTIWLER